MAPKPITAIRIITVRVLFDDFFEPDDFFVDFFFAAAIPVS
jgi:hypothetical protein